MVAMRVVNNLEREVLQSEWENWLVNEKALCDNLDVLISNDGQGSGGARLDPMEVVQNNRGGSISPEHLKTLKDFGATHCGSCKADFEQIIGEQRFDSAARGK